MRKTYGERLVLECVCGTRGMQCLDLFSGIGGMTMNLDVNYVALVEIDTHAQSVLKKKISRYSYTCRYLYVRSYSVAAF